MFTFRAVSRRPILRNTICGSITTRSLVYSRICLNDIKIKDAYQLEKVASEVSQPENLELLKETGLPKQETATFAELAKTGHVHKSILSAITRANFKTLTPVQDKSLVPILEEEKGVVCRAKTGTGKTLAFVIPTLQCALENIELSRDSKGKVQALVIAPTRDLALQIENEYKKILQYMPHKFKNKLRIEVHMGGRKTRTGSVAPAIVIATPGRLNDNLHNSRFADMFSDLKYRVYDEADRLLDEGFSITLDDIDRRLKDVREMLESTSTFKSVLFSATVDKTVSNFARSVIGEEYKFINCVDENEPEAHENIEQTLIKTNNVGESFNAALSFIINNMTNNGFKAMVFLPTITATDWFYSMLMNARDRELYDTRQTRKLGSKILRLHGKMSQTARDRTVRDYRRLSHGILVCTDVAARGLDFSDVSDVVQMGPSSEVADYIHKIGRTARAGASGKSILFLSSLEKNYIKALQTKRGVKFAHEIKHEAAEADRKLVAEIGSHAEDVESFIPAFLGFYKQIGSAYKISERDSLAQIMDYYRFLLGDSEAKLSVGKGFVRHVLNIPPREASLYFEVPGGFNFSATNNNRSSKRTFMDTSDRRGRNFNSRNDGPRNRGYSDRGSKGHFNSSRNDRNDFSNKKKWNKPSNKRDNRWNDGNNDNDGW